MAFPNLSAPILSDELQAVIGFAIVDRAFHDLLLARPRAALTTFDLSQRDRTAASSIRGASSLAEYAVRLEQRLSRAKHRGRVVVGDRTSQPAGPVKAAS